MVIIISDGGTNSDVGQEVEMGVRSVKEIGKKRKLHETADISL